MKTNMCEMITLPGCFSKVVVDGQTIARVNQRTDGQCECRKDGNSVLMSQDKAAHWLASIALNVAITTL